MNIIDLHGLYVREAIKRLKQRIAQCRRENQQNFVVIVGKGLHSEQGPRLKPAVLEYAQNSGLNFRPNSPNEGCVTFEFPVVRHLEQNRLQGPETLYGNNDFNENETIKILAFFVIAIVLL